MKELKKEFRWFNIMEYEKEENYLSKRHQEGWKFKRVTFPGVYTFERCESEKVIYQLDYNKEGIKHQMEYVRMFEDCGWEYLTEFDGYNYFRKPADKMQQEEEIFCIPGKCCGRILQTKVCDCYKKGKRGCRTSKYFLLGGSPALCPNGIEIGHVFDAILYKRSSFPGIPFGMPYFRLFCFQLSKSMPFLMEKDNFPFFRSESCNEAY